MTTRIRLSSPKNQFVFVYQTLRDRGIQEEVLGHEAHVVGSATLRDYHETTRETADDEYPTLVPQPGGEVRGELLEVTPAELDDLDDWENEYERMRVFPHFAVAPVWTYVLRHDAGGYDAAHASREHEQERDVY